ncbi:hypothetical protein BPTFM16_01088 [Altererythrobacter insulae]|nr:hypothetical protein BPTFM16_01088 [Altererythrobacter insulae]
MSTHTLSPSAKLLGYAGLLPQIIAVALVWQGGEWGYVALAGGFGYAALIYSFLGGVWWGQAIGAGRADANVYLVAVLPSLLALALFLPWTFGWEWPGPALLYLGALIAISPMVDKWLGLASADFLQLRWHLSLGLGLLTIILGVLAGTIVG